MRKMLWCSFAAGIVSLGGVFTVAYYAAHNPESLVGRAVLSAGRIATEASPVTMMNSAITRLENSRVEVVDEENQVGGEEAAEPEEMREVRGSIVIPENDEPAPLHAEIEPAFDHLVQVAHDDAVECAAGAADRPPVMPLCDQDECEKLGMPCSEGDAEEQEEAGTGSTGAIDKLFRLFEKSVKKSEEGTIEPVAPIAPTAPATETPDCQHDSHYHHHYSGCPYTGRGSMSCPSGSCAPSMPAPAPLTQPGSEEATEPSKPEQHSSILRAIRPFGTRGVDAEPARAQIDTMEYRAADGQLYDFGPGSM